MYQKPLPSDKSTGTRELTNAKQKVYFVLVCLLVTLNPSFTTLKED